MFLTIKHLILLKVYLMTTHERHNDGSIKDNRISKPFNYTSDTEEEIIWMIRR